MKWSAFEKTLIALLVISLLWSLVSGTVIVSRSKPPAVTKNESFLNGYASGYEKCNELWMNEIRDK